MSRVRSKLDGKLLAMKVLRPIEDFADVLERQTDSPMVYEDIVSRHIKHVHRCIHTRYITYLGTIIRACPPVWMHVDSSRYRQPYRYYDIRHDSWFPQIDTLFQELCYIHHLQSIPHAGRFIVSVCVPPFCMRRDTMHHIHAICRKQPTCLYTRY